MPQEQERQEVPADAGTPITESSQVFSVPASVRPHVPRIVTIIIVGIAVIGAAVYWGLPLLSGSAAPAAEKMRVIGILYFPQQNDTVLGFKQYMEELGYKEGVNVQYDMGKVIVGPTMGDDITAATDRMIAASEDLIFATFESHATVALEETKIMAPNLPIVFVTRFHDPVDFGLVASYKSSGNNSTGIATNVSETIGRTLGFFRDIDPNIKKIGVFSDGFSIPEIGGAYLDELRVQAPKFGMTLVEYKTAAPPPDAEADFHRVADAIKPGDIDALFHIAGHIVGPQEALESALAIRLKIPMSAPNEDLPNGGMFSYSDLQTTAGEQAAVLVDKIFTGANPSDIPIEYNAKSELSLVLGRAREAGFTFPESMLFISSNKFEDSSSFPEALHER